MNEFKILVTGSRDWTDRETIYDALDMFRKVYRDSKLILIHGAARGADTIAHGEYKRANFDDVRQYPAQWTIYGNAAGPIRNREMLDREIPIIVLAFTDHLETSKGTKDCVFEANKRGIPVYIYTSKRAREVEK